MKKTIVISVAFIACVAMFALSGVCNAKTTESHAVESVQGGVIEYSGNIGPYAVTFTFMNLHMGNGEEFFYEYKSARVNKGQPIELVYQRDSGAYSVYYEYINGKHTGTFKIIRTKSKITGTFKNSKGTTYKVNAKMMSSNWADE